MTAISITSPPSAPLPKTSYATPQEIKNALGHLAYILEGVKSLGILPIHVKITADDEQFEEDYLLAPSPIPSPWAAS